MLVKEWASEFLIEDVHQTNEQRGCWIDWWSSGDSNSTAFINCTMSMSQSINRNWYEDGKTHTRSSLTRAHRRRELLLLVTLRLRAWFVVAFLFYLKLIKCRCNDTVISNNDTVEAENFHVMWFPRRGFHFFEIFGLFGFVLIDNVVSQLPRPLVDW